MKPQIVTRIWHGKTNKEKAGEYLSILKKTGIRDYKKANGIRSVKILRKDTGNESHFWIVTEWLDIDSIKAFTFSDYDKAQYYKQDNDYLLEKEEQVLHLKSFNIFGELNQYIQDLKDLISGHNWVYVSAAQILNSIPYDKAIKTNLPNRHSIYEILHHSLVWRLFLLTRLKGTNSLNLEQNDDKDWPKTNIFTREDWEALKKKYFTTQEDLICALEAQEDQLLEERVPHRSYTFRYLIRGIINHDYYHLGQISLLR